MRSLAACSLVVLLVTSTAVRAAELEARTMAAYQEYVRDLETRFRRSADGEPFLGESTSSGRTRLLQGDVLAGPGHEDGIINVPGGLIHHWHATAFVPGITLAQILTTVQDYTTYNSVYRYIDKSELLSHQGNQYQVLLRLKQSVGPVTGVVDVRSRVEYGYPGKDRAIAVSQSESVRQVEDAGRANERLLPSGMDSGYLWGATTLTKYLERDGGVYVELDTVGLSRRFPPLLGWIIEPIARRLGRSSAEDSLRQLRRAMD